MQLHNKRQRVACCKIIYFSLSCDFSGPTCYAVTTIDANAVTSHCHCLVFCAIVQSSCCFVSHFCHCYLYLSLSLMLLSFLSLLLLSLCHCCDAFANRILYCQHFAVAVAIGYLSLAFCCFVIDVVVIDLVAIMSSFVCADALCMKSTAFPFV